MSEPQTSPASTPPQSAMAPQPPESIQALVPELTELRRDLHRHPELGYEETRTADVIARALEALGVDRIETGIGRTGVVATIHGRDTTHTDPEHAILLRADMDALPIEEATGLPYASSYPGRMHACGHDGHTTMLLGAARHLATHRDFFGTVHLCFQPAEENGAGAREMLRDGLLDAFPCRQVFGMHNWPNMPIGQFALRPGPIMAAGGSFDIQITGLGGHASRPDLLRNPIPAAAQIVTAIEGIVPRTASPFEAGVLSVTALHAGNTNNVVPPDVRMLGTIRSFDQVTQDRLSATLERTARHIASAYDLEATVQFDDFAYPPTVNDPSATEACARVLTHMVGADLVDTNCDPVTGSEDFSYLTEARPGCFVFIGNGPSAGLHHPAFDFNDDAIGYGVWYWTELAKAQLAAA